MRIVPLGGLGEIGRNMNVVEYNGHILLIQLYQGQAGSGGCSGVDAWA